MNFKLTNTLVVYNKGVLKAIMRTFIILFCSTLFSLSPKTGFTQDANIIIDSEKSISLEQVFELISVQTSYQFIYDASLLKNAPSIFTKKGIVKASELLRTGLDPIYCTYEFTDNTVIVKKKTHPYLNVPIQETFTISGVVKDENGLPIPGITVFVSSENPQPEDRNNIPKDFIVRGTATDIDGNFTLTVALNHYLIVSGLGYSPYSEKITTQSKESYFIVLKESVSKLNEVIVVGYGNVKRKDLTGSVSNIQGNELTESAENAQTVDETLSGRISGVFVTQNSGAPGAGARINIRGLSSINGDNQPLYVIDGVPVIITPRDEGSLSVERENPLLALNPQDIESVDVLKDASSAAIYGARAANGVIIITTKRGKRNQATNFNVDYNYSQQSPTDTYDLLNAQGYNQYVTAINPTVPITIGAGDTDWIDELYRNNVGTQNLNLGVSGGSEISNYALSGSIRKQEGLLDRTGLDRYSIRVAVDNYLFDNTFEIGGTISYNYSENELSGTSLNDIRTFRPDIPIFDEDGNFAVDTSLGTGPLALSNPAANNQTDAKAVSKNLLAKRLCSA